MTAPTWVGTTYIDPDDSWSLSWTITTADLPAGTQSGDLLLLWLIADAQSGASTAAPTGGWGLSGDWTLVRDQRSGTATQGYVGCFRSTYVAGALPQTLVPKSSTNATIDRSSTPSANWYGLLMAYRPSATFSADGGYSSTLTATTIYGGSGATQVFPDGVAGGTTVGVAAVTGSAAAPALGTTADFTEQQSQNGFSYRNGSLSAIGYIEDATLGNSIWIGGNGDSKVSTVDPDTLYAIDGYTITTSAPQDFAFDHGTSPGIWFSSGSGTTSVVQKIDLTSKTITASVTPGNFPAAMTFGDGDVWVGHINDNTIKRIDPATATVSATITLGTTERAGYGGIYAAGFAWFFNYGTGNVFKINPTTNALTTITALPDLTTGLAYDGTKVWAVSNRDRAIYTINVSTNAVTKQTATNFLTGTTDAMAWDGSFMWVINDGKVSRIDPATYTILATVDPDAGAVGSANGIVYLNGFVYVTLSASELVAKIDVDTDIVVDTFDMGLAKVRGGFSHIDRQFASAYSGTKPQWTKSTTVYGAAVFAAFGPSSGVGWISDRIATAGVGLGWS